jgi:ABC-type sulfate/molybdate transport systems ATPase subunit
MVPLFLSHIIAATTLALPAMIAMALAAHPKLLIADEPTTALDVTTQAQILELLRRLQEQNGMAIMLITHDLGVIAEMADGVVVMYLGRVVEEGAVDDIFYIHSTLRAIEPTSGEILFRTESGSVVDVAKLSRGQLRPLRRRMRLVGLRPEYMRRYPHATRKAAPCATRRRGRQPGCTAEWLLLPPEMPLRG